MNPYPSRYRTAFASSRLLYLLPSRPHLRSGFLKNIQEDMRLTTFRLFHRVDDLGAASPPEESCTAYCDVRAQYPYPLPFWFRCVQPLAPVNTYEVYRRFTFVLHIIRSWLPTGMRLPELTAPHGLVSTLTGRASLSSDASHPTEQYPATQVEVGNIWQYIW